jgi:Xaa-Pro aminopeptidase
MDLSRARAKMAENGFDGLIANTGPNFYYATQFTAPLP